MAKMGMSRYEDSPTDKRMDRAGAKKAGVTLAEWEGSPADERMDRMGQAKMGGSAPAASTDGCMPLKSTGGGRKLGG